MELLRFPRAGRGGALVTLLAGAVGLWAYNLTVLAFGLTS
jgi:hypothetical protein